MEQVKMSDTFTLPLSFRICGDKGGELIENGFPVFMRGCKYKTESAAIAINSYDKHVELIAKQAEQIKMLREALELVRPEVYYNQDGVEVWAGGSMTIGTDDDVDSKTMQKIHEALSAMEQE
jgi:hypothetical protein